MDDNLLPFKISSGLKNIIGKDLITDDFVAVFELVKNSFDAYAKEVIIKFLPDKIIISDDGKGMDIDDINKKWLFVAYSAKKEGVEDDELAKKEFETYRDKIQAKKYYAGAKGIGRFSCDRLGKKLTLTTKKASNNPKTEQIEVNWLDFEENSEKEFMEINVKHRTLGTDAKKIKNFQHGTIIEISNLNYPWERKKKQELRHSLEKLINPFEDLEVNYAERVHKFKIYIDDESEKEADKKAKNKRDIVHGEVKNFVFEALDLKTTQIITDIDEKYITSTLKDRGTLIYKIRKQNNTNPNISNVHFHLYYLNRAAKANFLKLMGIPAIQFGSIFLYKNGFRVSPYGNDGDDSFGIDSRHAQGVWRTLGLRDLIGRIDIIGSNKDFKETSSRDGGLVKNEHFHAMMRCFDKFCLSKLEEYVTKIQWKNKDDNFNENLSALENIQTKSKLLEIISDEIEDENSILEDIDTEFINLRSKELLYNANEKEIKNLENIAEKFGNEEYLKKFVETRREFEEVKREREELIIKLKAEEIERKRLEEEYEAEKKKLEAELEAEKKETLFNKKLAGTDIKEIVSLQHHIDRAAEKINKNVHDLISGINNESPKNALLKFVEKISLESKKISSIVQFVTNANFNVKANSIERDLNRFIREYILEVHQEYEHLILNRQIIPVALESDNKSFIYNFRPLEIVMIIDNLFSNSLKARAKNVVVRLNSIGDNIFEMNFRDNGDGISDSILSRIFNLGFTTTTGGAGIGLYHVKQLLDKMKANIEVNNKVEKGVEFKIKFYKR